MNLPQQVEWQHPWEPILDENDAKRLRNELEQEASTNHPLFRVDAIAVARRVDCDDVLFLTDLPDRPLAVVHLTWRGSTEANPQWPGVRFFESWQEWQEHCLLPGGEGGD